MTADDPVEEASQSEVARPGPQDAAQPMDELGLPIQKQPVSTSARVRVATVLTGSIVAAGLAAVGIARHQLPGYLQALCWLSGLTATAVGALFEDKKEEYERLSPVTRAAVLVAAALALIGVVAMALVVEHLHD